MGRIQLETELPVVSFLIVTKRDRRVNQGADLSVASAESAKKKADSFSAFFTRTKYVLFSPETNLDAREAIFMLDFSF